MEEQGPAPGSPTTIGESRKGRAWFSEGLIIAATPVLAYMITFTYEAGFAAFFGIPSEFISLNLTTFFLVAFYLGLIVFLLLAIAALVLILTPARDHPLYRRVLGVLPVFLSTVGYIVIFGSYWREWALFLPGVVILIVFLFVLPAVVHRDKGKYVDRLRAADQVVSKSASVFDRVMEKGGSTVVTGFLYVWIILSLSHAAGRSSALRQREFLVTSTSPEMVVLRVYGDNLIAAPLDRERKRVQRSFVILRMAADPKLQLRLERVGPLTSDALEGH
jgi:hypothetical protein